MDSQTDIKLREETLSALKKEDGTLVDEICTKVLSVLSTLKSTDIRKQMTESKEIVYEQANSKINTDSSLVRRIQRARTTVYFRYLSAASVALLLILSTAAVTYRIGLRSGNQRPVPAQVEMNVPYGVMSKVALSDGTVVTLNGGSKLTYPASFEGGRQVSLSGEGFFDVAKDEEHPFIIQAKNISVKVLGTRFAFKAYEEDSHTVLTLESGRIQAIPLHTNEKDIFLNPNQQLVLDNRNGEFQRIDVKAEEYTSWKDGVLCFRDLTLKEIATELERRFDVKIQILSDELKSEQYFAQFKNGENAEQILHKLSFKHAWKAVKRQDQIEIKSINPKTK
jgi:ferric-dicitrate binding protein FerR (iron transport regulator)